MKASPTTFIITFLSVFIMAVSACAPIDEIGPPPCPQATTLDDASHLIRFHKGAGRDLIDVDFEAEIVKLQGSCEYLIDEDTGTGTLLMEASVRFKLVRGPANRTRKAAFDYFVSIVDHTGQIVQKQLFPFEIDFSNNRMQLRKEDAPVELIYPIDTSFRDDDINIFIGIQLTREELDYIRNSLHH